MPVIPLKAKYCHIFASLSVSYNFLTGYRKISKRNLYLRCNKHIFLAILKVQESNVINYKNKLKQEAFVILNEMDFNNDLSLKKLFC